MFQPAMFQLTESEKQLLLTIARASVGLHLLSQPLHFPYIPTGALTESHGIFVSLHKHDRLRGCIGNIQPVDPLYRTAADCAIGAAVRDPRFEPLTLDELQALEFEISVLSSMETVTNVADVEVGRHGLLITKNRFRGLLLPQVATTYGWDRERFLDETCKKAGLHAGDWKDGATIQCFSASVFCEKQFQFSATS
jgi:AmmeMemoRadiSam system protein A